MLAYLETELSSNTRNLTSMVRLYSTDANKSITALLQNFWHEVSVEVSLQLSPYWQRSVLKLSCFVPSISNPRIAVLSLGPYLDFSTQSFRDSGQMMYWRRTKQKIRFYNAGKWFWERYGRHFVIIRISAQSQTPLERASFELTRVIKYPRLAGYIERIVRRQYWVVLVRCFSMRGLYEDSLGVARTKVGYSHSCHRDLLQIRSCEQLLDF